MINNCWQFNNDWWGLKLGSLCYLGALISPVSTMRPGVFKQCVLSVDLMTVCWIREERWVEYRIYEIKCISHKINTAVKGSGFSKLVESSIDKKMNREF